MAMPILASPGPGIRVGISLVVARGWLEIEDYRHAVGPVQAVDLEEGGDELVDVGKGLSGAVALELARVDACEGHPGRPLHLLVP
jgi:hypothetical protein